MYICIFAYMISGRMKCNGGIGDDDMHTHTHTAAPQIHTTVTYTHTHFL